MKAIICEKPMQLAVVERNEPIRQAAEVLVRIRRVGLCGTDYHIFKGNQPFLEYPRVMGHELAGEVVETPDGSAFKAGQLVTINPYLACAICSACRKGKPNCCRNIAVLGVHIDGGMCELISVPERAVVDATGLSLEQAAMVEFLAIGAHAVSRAKISSMDRVLVVGAGPIGLAATIFSRLEGARITLIDTQPARLANARRAIDIDDVRQVSPSLDHDLADMTGGEMYDVVFDATGAISAMNAGLQYVGHGGTYVLISVVKDELSFPDPEFHKRETTLLASRNALASDFDRVIEAIRDGLVPTNLLHTHSLDAQDLPNGLPSLANNCDGLIKAIASF